jgi:sugar/nucleoside kinase (ribokinase family)
MTPRVLVAGDANLDLVVRGDVRPRFGQAEQLLDSAELVLGSSAGICAAGLARLGVDTAIIARVGTDVFGARTRELLADAGVDARSLAVSDQPTGLSVILAVPGDRAILTLTGALAGLTAAEVLAAADGAQHVHVAAFFLLPDLVRDLPAVLAELRARGVTTSLDTNWDPAELWTGVEACLPHLDLLLPNGQEALAIARALDHDPADALGAASSLARRGPTVVVKDGAAGGFAVTPDGAVVHAPGLTVDVVDTIGAGDGFDAGFLAAWLDGRPLAEAVRWGAVAGSLSTRGVGGTGGQATRAEVEAELPG